jgi:cation diffusion facilitator CzcD-associated flavoprotein CzcO
MPNIPAIPGLESFAGTAFHSAQWQHDHDLTGRKVAVIGTGASAVQFVPQIAPSAESLDLYQRSAAWVIPKPDRPISAREQRLYAKLSFAQRVVRDLIYWVMEIRGAGFTLGPKAMAPIERSAKQHLAAQIPESDLRAKLTPDYRVGCKRLLISNDYYPALSRANVDVVTDRIVEVRPHGIVTADGSERAADTIIFGTGFEVSGNLTRMKIVGRDGADLNDVWDRNGIGAYLGITMTGFPNLFLLLGPNTGLGHTSVLFMMEAQIDYILQALDLLDKAGADYVDVRPGAQQGFLDRIQTRLADTVWQSGCKSWYHDKDGRNFTIWPYFTWRYWLETRRLNPDEYHLGRSSPELSGRRTPDPVQ